VTKARDLANIISGGFTVSDLPTLTSSEIPNLDAAKITSGTFADARIASSSVTQHASSYIDWQSVVTASTLNAVSGKGYPINTTSNTCTITMPSNPSVGDTIKFVDYARNFGTNKIIINPNSKNFQGNTSPNPEYNTTGQSITCTYIDVTQGWIPTVDDDVTMETPQTVTADFLCIAGGGGGGRQNAGGGGAGGYRNSFNNEASGGGGSSETALTLTQGAVYTITVGDGGTNTNARTSNGGNGNDSSIIGTGISITSIGGGGGSSDGSGSGFQNQGGAGGSGGGSASGTAGGSGTSNQGYDGGSGYSGANSSGGGGGGASAVGETAPQGRGGNGGNGLSSSITGSAVTRAGGGGGVTEDSGGNMGTAGTGGASAGSYGGSPSAGTVNTGSGGGGSHQATSGAGGKGVVILRMATADYTGTTSGSPTVDQSTVSGQTILIFNASGSYTA
jgi:hypothetical protein